MLGVERPPVICGESQIEPPARRPQRDREDFHREAVALTDESRQPLVGRGLGCRDKRDDQRIDAQVAPAVLPDDPRALIVVLKLDWHRLDGVGAIRHANACREHVEHSHEVLERRAEPPRREYGAREDSKGGQPERPQRDWLAREPGPPEIQ